LQFFDRSFIVMKVLFRSELVLRASFRTLEMDGNGGGRDKRREHHPKSSKEERTVV